MRTEPRLSHNNVSTPEQASITDEKVRSDRVERLFFSVADSMGITGRIEFKWHSATVRPDFFFFATAKTIVSPMGGVMACNPPVDMEMQMNSSSVMCCGCVPLESERWLNLF